MIEHHSHEGDDDDAIEGELQDFCNDGKNVVISKSNLESDLVGSVVSANKAIRRCGFVYLDSLYESDVVANWTKSFREFMKRENGGGDWRYPCQGIGRSEVMLPFEEPFNETSIYGNIHLRSILAHAFKGTFKMELQTVITSSPGSGNQRWHQGWRYLFDQNERRQKYSYAIIVGVVLEDLTEEMGPTEFCAGYNVKFYDGLRCPEKPVAAAMSSGGTFVCVCVCVCVSLTHHPSLLTTTKQVRIYLITAFYTEGQAIEIRLKIVRYSCWHSAEIGS